MRNICFVTGNQNKIIEVEKENGSVLMPEPIIEHLEKSIHSLDESITKVNDNLDSPR